VEQCLDYQVKLNIYRWYGGLFGNKANTSFAIKLKSAIKRWIRCKDESFLAL